MKPKGHGELNRRDLLKAALAGVALTLPLAGCGREPSARAAAPRPRPGAARRLDQGPPGRRAVPGRGPTGPRRDPDGELAAGTPYVPHTLETYLAAGGDPAGPEPLTLSLTGFDCVTLVEACLAVGRGGAVAEPSWDRFGREVERMRYRGGERRGYASRLHYFSEWIADGERRGLVRDLGAELGATADRRPLRFMTEHRGSYQALADDGVLS